MFPLCVSSVCVSVSFAFKPQISVCLLYLDIIQFFFWFAHHPLNENQLAEPKPNNNNSRRRICDVMFDDPQTSSPVLFPKHYLFFDQRKVSFLLCVCVCVCVLPSNHRFWIFFFLIFSYHPIKSLKKK